MQNAIARDFRPLKNSHTLLYNEKKIEVILAGVYGRSPQFF